MDDRSKGRPLISLVMPYYKNPSMLAIQAEAWDLWPAHLKSRFEIILVDDGSPAEKARDVLYPTGFRRYAIYEVLEDRKWHQHGARNLGADRAAGDWLILTDMDHQLEADVAEELAFNVDEGNVSPRAVYMFDRIEADTRKPTIGRKGEHKPHPNSWFLTREAYWDIGGYDEDYCGIYGTDALFRKRCFEKYERGQLTGIPLVRYWRDIVSDASTRDVLRKEGRPKGATAAIRKAKADRGKEHVIKTLAFPWRLAFELEGKGV